MEPTEGFTQVLPEMTIPCCDLWAPHTLTDAKMAAYRQLIRDRQIILRQVTVFGTGHITVEYVSHIPHAWTLDRLASVLGQEGRNGTR